LKSEDYVFTAGVYSPIQAKIAEMVGLKLVYVSGYSCSLGYLGKADLGLLSMAEMTTFARYISRAVSLPVLADADDGYGSAIVAMRTVHEFEASGVAGIHVEDQRGPKRCGHLVGKQVLPFDEAVLKFKAIVKAKQDPDFVIIARTDARGVPGGSLDEAIRRSLAYAEAGADLLWCEFTSPEEVEEFRAFAEAVHREYPDMPLVFNYSSSFKWSESRRRLTFRELGTMGYKLILVSLGGIHAAMYAVWNFFDDLKNSQEKAQFRLEEMKRGHPTEDHHRMGDFDYFKRIEEQFLPPETVKQRYAGQGGHGGEKRT